MKLRRKLLSAGFALGATALTLTTSTFAWYTSNTSVTTGNVSGVTSTEADTSSFYIAAAQLYDQANNYAVSTVGSYTNKATPVLTGTTDKVLTPVSYVDGTGATNKYLPLNGAEGASVTYGNYSANNIYEWVYRFRTGTAGTAVDLYFKDFNFTTTLSSDAETLYALAYGDGTGISGAGAYFADLAKAMKLTIVETPMSDASTLGSTATTSTYSLAAWASQADQNITSANAVGYYNTVLDTSIAKPASYDSEIAAAKTGTAIKLATIPADSGYVEVRFTLWLDGWDEYCYDICRFQEFELSFDVQKDTTNTGFCTAA